MQLGKAQPVASQLARVVVWLGWAWMVWVGIVVATGVGAWLAVRFAVAGLAWYEVVVVTKFVGARLVEARLVGAQFVGAGCVAETWLVVAFDSLDGLLRVVLLLARLLRVGAQRVVLARHRWLVVPWFVVRCRDLTVAWLVDS